MADYVHKDSYYINNDEFYQALVERKNEVNKALANNQPKPPISKYIVECIIKICTHLSYRPNFNRYTFKDEMVASAIENCFKKIENFNPERSNNPFFYTSRVASNAFIRVILEERKETFIRGKIIQSLPFDLYDLELQDSENTGCVNEFIEIVQTTGAFNGIVEKEELRMSKKKSKLEAAKVPVPVVAGPLDMLFEDSE